MLDIAKGLDYLHKRKPTIVHRDMKSSNVLITARGVAKIADFGLARVRNSTRSIIKSLVGTVNWQAPELWVAHPRYNEKVDVYSAALVFWECLQWHLSQKRYPFEGMNEHAIYHEVGGKQFRPSTATMRRQWGGEPLDLIDRMWAQDPKQRPDMSEVVKDLEGLIKAEKARARAAAH
jgi:serine/threonine protein kinase